MAADDLYGDEDQRLFESSIAVRIQSAKLQGST